MKFSLTPCHSQTRRWLTLGATALPIALAIGCASPGPPHLPSLNLPEVVKDLTAERVGDAVRLHWTTPDKTTDRLAIKGVVTAEICRVIVPSASPAASVTPVCTVVKSLPVQTGPAQAEDTLPPSLTVDPPGLLAYRVQLLNANGRTAGPSAEALAASGAAPPPVEQLRATPVREGVQLQWQQRDTTAPVQLDRLLVAPDGTTTKSVVGKKSSPTPKPSPKPRSRSRRPATPSSPANPQALPMTTPTTPDEVRLQTPKQTADAGGTIDQTTRKGESYGYTAQRVREITLEGHTLKVRSEISAPVTVAVLDIFPPAIPTGLEAIPGGATGSDRSIDLSWTPNIEADLAGYSVYRQEVTSAGQVAGPATRLNPTPVVGPAYRDQTAVPDHRYAYRVTAVDAAGNESAPSADVQETLREQ